MNDLGQGKIHQIRFTERVLKSITKNKETNTKKDSSGINNDIDGIQRKINDYKSNINDTNNINNDNLTYFFLTWLGLVIRVGERKKLYFGFNLHNIKN